ncbi:MAG: MFS transporter, partial [Bacteroidetes bacterium]|nr:MFS transporter [Bacteroidota bacterium]
MKTLALNNRWTPLFVTQFLGVLNDNFLKNLICFVGIYWLAEDQQSLMISIATALLVLPYILFSPLAGSIAKRYSKKRTVEIAKFLEIPIMLVAVVGFGIHSIHTVMAALFLMGLQSAIYSPSKYGLIRDIGGKEGISFGTGTMELFSFTAMLLGALFAGYISDQQSLMHLKLSVVTLGLATAGWLSSRRIKAVEHPPQNDKQESYNPVTFLIRSFQWSKRIKGLNAVMLALGTFWLMASMLQMNLLVYLPQSLGFSNTQTGLTMALVAIGIGLGCWVAGLLSFKRVELGIAPIGALGMSVCITMLVIMQASTMMVIGLLFLSSFFSGFFKVPLSSWIQDRVEGRKLGDILAYNNLTVFLFILISSILFAIVQPIFGSMAIFMSIAVISWVMFTIMLVRLPAWIVRFIALLLAHSIYRIKLRGKDKLPVHSGGLLVVNHLSYLDSLMVIAAAPRMVRFVMLKDIYESRFMNWFAKRLFVIPVAHKGGRKAIEEFNKLCQDEINKGHMVCIFAEGQISKNGQLLTFRRGIEYISAGINAPIIPIHLGNVSGSPLSF